MYGLRWTPGIGDPTATGWVIVFSYFLSALLCLRAMMAEKSGKARPYIGTVLALLRVLLKNWKEPPLPAKRAGIWLALAAALVFLGVNKQLDLQTLLTEIGRIALSYGDLYNERRMVQAAFLLAIGAAGVLGLIALFRWARGSFHDFRVPFFGLTVLVAFVLTRAAAFLRIGSLFGSPSLGTYFNFFLELVGILIIGASAYSRALRR